MVWGFCVYFVYMIPLETDVLRKHRFQKSSKDEYCAEKNPHGEKSLRGKNSCGENKNVNIYLKHTQMCQTDCKSEPKLDFRPLNRFLKIPAGIFSPKIPAGKNPRGEK